MPSPARTLLLIAALLASTPLFAAETQTRTLEEANAVAQMQALQAELGQGKREFVDRYMQLSPDEAAKFWPVYDAHQAALADLNQRRLDNVMAYARVWNADAMDDASARSLAKEAIAIEKDEAALLKRTFGKASKALSPTKAARYLHIEAKVRALVRFEQATRVPLMK